MVLLIDLLADCYFIYVGGERSIIRLRLINLCPFERLTKKANKVNKPTISPAHVGYIKEFNLLELPENSITLRIR